MAWCRLGPIHWLKQTSSNLNMLNTSVPCAAWGIQMIFIFNLWSSYMTTPLNFTMYLTFTDPIIRIFILQMIVWYICVYMFRLVNWSKTEYPWAIWYALSSLDTYRQVMIFFILQLACNLILPSGTEVEEINQPVRQRRNIASLCYEIYTRNKYLIHDDASIAWCAIW